MLDFNFNLSLLVMSDMYSYADQFMLGLYTYAHLIYVFYSNANFTTALCYKIATHFILLGIFL